MRSRRGVTSSASQVDPAFVSRPSYKDTLGPEVADVCRLAGFEPDPEQQLALDILFAFQPSGLVSAFEFALICSRQNMKTGLFKMAALGWLFVTEQRLIVWSAHEMKTTKEAFLDLENLITGAPALKAQLATGPSEGIHRGNGEESIELATGQRVMFKARTNGGGRGLSGDKVILDEAFALKPSHMGSLLPTLSARPDPQVVYGSSAGLSESGVLRGIRDRGRPGGDPSLAYLEWCDDLGGECETLGCLHEVGAVGCKLDDPRRWQRANPAMGRRITQAYIAAERRALPPTEFARERLGWWDEPGLETQVVSVGDWQDLLDVGSAADRIDAFAIEVSLDRAVAAIGMAGTRADGLIHVEAIELRRGTGWVVARCVELNAAHGPAMFAVDGGGPANSLIADLEAAGLKVAVAQTRDVGIACAGFVDAVGQKLLRHGPQPELLAAVMGAKKRPLGDGAFAFGRKASGVDISTLQAVTLAHWAASTHSDDLSAINNVW
jgi:hypothetical protein